MKKIMGIVKLAIPMSRESLPFTMREDQDIIYFLESKGEDHVCIPLFPYIQLNQEAARVVRYEKIEGLPGKAARPVKSLEGFTVLTRSWIPQTPCVLRAIEKLGGKNEITLTDCGMIDSWPRYILPDFLKRKVSLTTLEKLASVGNDYEVDGKLFVKTKVKANEGHGKLISIDEARLAITHGLPYACSYSDDPHKVENLSPETELIVSQPVKFNSKDGRKLEYRSWVFNNEAQEITRYGYKDEIDVPSKVRSFVSDFAQAHKNTLPKHYVLDVGELENGDMVVVEMNHILSSGNLSVPIFEKIYRSFTEKN